MFDKCIVLLGLLLAAIPARGQEAFVYRETPLRAVISEVEAATGYRFLYRDAVVAGVPVSLQADTTDVLSALERALRPRGLALRVDAARRQVLLHPAPRRPKPPGGTAVLTGQVVDAAEGTPLPYATVSLRDEGRLRGASADEGGTFRLVLPQGGPVKLTASYVGYRPEHAYIDPADVPSELTLRLRPTVEAASEVVVTGSGLDASLDTALHDLARPGTFATLGEPSVLRSLQPLPAVGLSGALSSGLVVRGTAADGFQVLLDGIPIYNQQHLFGLFDAFHAGALQTVGFYYDVAPATYAAPPGGTLAYVTRAGSRTALRAEVGATNTAGHVTVEGPLPVARGSGGALVSVRRSYLGAPFGSTDLIRQGLDSGDAAGRRAAVAEDERLVIPEAPSAHFFDVHARLDYETPDRARWSATAYAGGNRAQQDARRLVQVPGARDRTVWRRTDVTTESRWGNEAAGLRHARPLGPHRSLQSLLAGTRYYGRYREDDFVYSRRRQEDDQPSASLQSFIRPFLNENELRQTTWEQRLDGIAPAYGLWSLGYAWHYLDATYAEASALRTGYRQRTAGHQADLFAQADLVHRGVADLRLGVRAHYFSLGGYARLSPRLRVHLAPQRPLSVAVGYSRNHQFVHRLTLRTTTSADVWVTTMRGQPPTGVDHLTAGLYARPGPSVLLQLEAYYKRSRNVRRHEIDVPAGETPALTRRAPWFWDNDAFARGLEALYRHRRGTLAWSLAYTLARVELQHEAVAGGDRYPADWDRRHQLTATLEVWPARAWTATLAWLYASGAPNDLARSLSGEPDRLAPYHRLDASVRYRRTVGRAAVEASAAAFNLYDRDNPWYRTPVAEIDADRRPRRLTFVPVDVYDLGVQPSFAVSVVW